jgi:hypothetical protein
MDSHQEKMEATRANQRELMAIMKASQEETETKMKASLRMTEVDPHLGLYFFSQWKMIPPMQCLRSGASATGLNVVAFDGEELNSAEVLHSDTNEWTFIHSMRNARSGVALWNKIIVCLPHQEIDRIHHVPQTRNKFLKSSAYALSLQLLSWMVGFLSVEDSMVH